MAIRCRPEPTVGTLDGQATGRPAAGRTAQMAKGDLFKRSLEAGTSFLDMTRERAESMVKEWVDAGDLGKGRAQKAVEQVLDRLL
ncbi:MAG TPA: hypothetical protein VG455_00980, partial [Acidimicrobiales bacterium]|nr:hypothetical protein [Acidimicrobiales bacterium]